MYTSTWLGTLNDSFMQIWAGFLSYLPVLLGAVIIFLVGWIIAATIGRLIEKLIRTVKLDVALAKLGLDRLMSRANMRLDSGKFLGELVKQYPEEGTGHELLAQILKSKEVEINKIERGEKKPTKTRKGKS